MRAERLQPPGPRCRRASLSRKSPVRRKAYTRPHARETAPSDEAAVPVEIDAPPLNRPEAVALLAAFFLGEAAKDLAELDRQGGEPARPAPLQRKGRRPKPAA